MADNKVQKNNKIATNTNKSISKSDFDALTTENEKLIVENEKLKKRKKYGLVWEEKESKESFNVDMKNHIPYILSQNQYNVTSVSNDNDEKSEVTNILIEGDNFNSLSVLNYTHKGKIDAIYIDPPYNNGKKTWKYNNNYIGKDDAYFHSRWLNMMSKRLKLAKKLLKKNGVLICSIDENELFHLGCLFEDIFPEFEKHLITVIHNFRGIQGKNISYINEFVFYLFRKNQEKIIETKKLEKFEKSNFRNWGGESLREDAENCFYPVLIKNNEIIGFGGVLDDKIHPSNRIETNNAHITSIWPIDRNGIERKWRYARQSVEEIQELLSIEDDDEIHLLKTHEMVKTVWKDKRYSAGDHGTALINRIVPNNDFEFPKSLWLVHDCLDVVVRNRKKAIILDFFAGSGTTGHAVMELNKKDHGDRQFILCTNNEISLKMEKLLKKEKAPQSKFIEEGICRKICHPRIKNVMEGYIDTKNNERVMGLGGNLKYYKTDLQKLNTTDKIKKEISNNAIEMLCLKENCFDIVDSEMNNFIIFKNQTNHLGIAHNKSGVNSLKKFIKKNDHEQKYAVYIFTLDLNPHRNEFKNLENVKLKPIPQEILNSYFKIKNLS